MTAHRKDPFRRVVKAELQNDEFGRCWELKLECGHEDVRGVSYKKKAGSKWGGRRQDGCVRSLDEALPAPKQVRCSQCKGRVV